MYSLGLSNSHFIVSGDLRRLQKAASLDRELVRLEFDFDWKCCALEDMMPMFVESKTTLLRFCLINRSIGNSNIITIFTYPLLFRH